MSRTTFRFGALGLLLLAACAAQGGTDLDKRVDDIFQEWSKPGTPGAAVAVIQSGKIVCTKGYGLANLEYDVPVTAQTIYHVASVSKQFTAANVVLAAERYGKHKTISQIVAVISLLVLAGYEQWGAVGRFIFGWNLFGQPWINSFTLAAVWVSVILTFTSGSVYLWKNRALYTRDL